MKSLDRLKKIVYSEGVLPDHDFMKVRLNRIGLANSYPDSFLSKSPDGTPVFPIRNQHGGISYTILKRGLTAAKSRHRATGDAKYMDIIRKIEEELRKLETKIHHVPRVYFPHTHLVDVLGGPHAPGRFDNVGDIE